MQTFHLPDLGEGLTEAVLVRWAVAVGDEIVLDQVIAEVETAKSIVDLPTPYAGTVLALHGEEGGTILTGAPVIEVGDGSAAPDTPAAAPHAAEHEAYRAEEQAGSGNVLIDTARAPARPGTTAPRRNCGSASSTSERHTILSRSRGRAPPRRPPGRGTLPIVRRLARELGIDPATVAPSGTDGAVTRADVLRAAENTASQASEPVAPLGAEPSQLTVISSERFSPLRKAVSATLSRSRSEIPEATVWVDVDVTRLWELRSDMAAPGERAPSVTALFARYALLALEQYPLLASRIVGGGTELALFDGVHLGVAVDTERGLMVPVIPRADTLSLAAIDGALRELAATARDGKMPPERLRDSTFTVNNYGGFGVDGSAAIINYPNVAILGIGRILERPWVVEGAIVPRRIAQLSLVFDHRVCDGGYAAGFLRAVVDLLEHPLTAYPRV
ncbi:dihydrolipoamide acetyltransferase family protein [Leucobacter luti]|uniref:dihydrolipoamide acetyltransferase family protein n=1 Tax=Leucobacter luti TaxID=340320 RepID=UPI001C68AF2D|nr:dihydrolipoamide acetyltransferase family protein [Leucobacter luti]QYM76764.1 2-oxo acid dehydrogenase subunit E2 [Leucobacter luti]